MLITGSINVAEVFGFLVRYRNRESANEGLSFILEAAFVIPLSTELAVQAALAKHEKGFGLADAVVYATAKDRGAFILTGDADFKDVEGVRFLG